MTDAQKGIVSCDECKKAFKIEPVSQALADGGEKNYFVCPHCGIRFVFAEVTPVGVDLHNRIQAKRREFGKARIGRARTEIQGEILALQNKLACEVSRYRERVPAGATPVAGVR